MNVAGIDLGDHQVAAVIVDETGRVLARASEPVNARRLQAAVRTVHRAVRSTQSVDATGVTLPFHTETLSPELQSAINEDAAVIAHVVNAGHARVLAETWCGAARGFRNVVSFAVGEHVTAGILMDGNIVTGSHGHAASVAWLALNPVEREDYRRQGGLEAEVGSTGIVRRLVWRIKSGDRSKVTERVNGDLTRLTADDVFAAARDGDGVCVSVIRDSAKYVGMAIANLASVLDPECVVLGGTLATSGDLMLDAIRTECARRLRPAQADSVRIVLSALGDDSAAIGAARAAMLHRR